MNKESLQHSWGLLTLMSKKPPSSAPSLAAPKPMRPSVSLWWTPLNVASSTSPSLRSIVVVIETTSSKPQNRNMVGQGVRENAPEMLGQNETKVRARTRDDEGKNIGRGRRRSREQWILTMRGNEDDGTWRRWHKHERQWQRFKEKWVWEWGRWAGLLKLEFSNNDGF